MINKLTINQEKFAQEVVRCGKQEEALVIAYPTCKKWQHESIRVKASRMMGKANISVRIAQLQDEAASRNKITVDRVLKEYAKLAFTDLPGIIKFDGVKMMVEDFDNLTANQRACIQSFKVKTEQVLDYDDNGKPQMTPVSMVEVKLYSKQAALDKLSEFMGIGKKTADEDDYSVPVVFEVSQTINIQNNYTTTEAE